MSIIFICLSSTAFALGSGDTSLLTWWKMDDVSGTVVNDYADNMNGTIGTENSWTYDSLYFPGQDFNYGASKVSCDESIFSQISDEITITFWAKNDMPNCTGNCYFFTAEIGGSQALQIDLTGNPTANLMFKAADTDNTAWIRSAWSTNQENYTDPNLWNYYSFTKNASTGTMKIYINGQLRTVSTGSNTSMAGIDSFEICGSSANYHQWAGWVKDFRIYNKELYSEEIGILCKSYDPALEAWYKFDQGSGTVAYDATGSGNDAAISRSDRWDSGGLKGSDCLANLNLYGTLDVTIPSSAFESIDKQMTVSMWIWTDPVRLQGGICRGYDSTGSNILSLGIYNDASQDNQYITAVIGAEPNGVHDLRWWWGYQDYYYPHQGSWHHLAMTKDCDNKIERIYYDGQMQGAYTPDPNKTMDGIETLKLFAHNTSNWWEYFRGKIDDVKIYSRALTSQEISRIAAPDMFAGDFNYDTVIDNKDLKLLAEDWLDSGSFITADADNDEDVDMIDYAWLAKNYAPGDWEKPGWRLTFHDEFNGDTLDTIKWSIGYPGWHAGNSAPMAFPHHDHSLYEMIGGVLRLVNEKRDYDDGVLKHYVCGLIQSAHKFDQAYGWFECRAKMPGHDGDFPAFWLFPYGSTYTPAAEVDIMEHIHRWGEYTSSGMHWNGYGDDHQSVGSGRDSVPGVWTSFHTYALEWEPGLLTFYIDGNVHYSYSGPEVPSVPLWIILNNALEIWHGPIDDSALPAYFEVDYVRVYEKTE